MNVWESLKQAPWYHLLERPRETLERLFKLSDIDLRTWDDIFGGHNGSSAPK